MVVRSGRVVTGVGLAVSVLLCGCGLLTGNISNLFNPNLLSSLGLAGDVASLPDDAPGLLMAVENRTDRWARMVVSYRDGDGDARSYTTLVAPGDKSAQMLVCPIEEITLGDVSNLSAAGARVFLVDNVTDTAILDVAPYIEVDAFGVLLSEGVNYDCGEGVTFTLQTSSDSASGYRVFAYIRRVD